MNTSTQQYLQLEQFYRGKWWENGQEKSDYIITACSQDISSTKAERLFAAANLGSFNRLELASLQHGYGLLQADANTFLMVHVRPGPRRARGYVYADYRCIVVPSQVISAVAGNLQILQTLFDDTPHLPELAANNSPLPKVTLALETLSVDREIELVQPLFQGFAYKPELLGQLLSALIAERSVAVLDAPPDPAWRWAICQALLLVLPPQLRQRWTFATEVFDSDSCRARFKFLYKDPHVRSANADFQYRWQNGEFRPQFQAIHLYAQLIIQRSTQGPHWLIETLYSEETNILVNRLKAYPLDQVLSILADQLTIVPRIKQGKVQHQDWEVMKRLLTNQIRLFATPELAPEDAAWLMEDTQNILRKITEQGLGDKAYAFLSSHLRGAALDPATWRSTLEWIAIEHLHGQGYQLEAQELLDFISAVRQTQDAVSAEFWNDFVETLRPLCAKDDKVTLALLDLWIEHPTRADYKDFLFDATTSAHFPEDLAVLRRYWLDPAQEAPEPPISLVSIRENLPHNKSRFFLDMVEQAIAHKTFSLIDESALNYLTRLAQRPEHEERVLHFANQLLAAKEQLGQEATKTLPRLLVELSQIDQAVELIANIAQSPDLQKVLLKVVEDLCCTVPLPKSLQFLQKLNQSSLPDDVIAQSHLSTLEHPAWKTISTMTSEIAEQAKRIALGYAEFLLGEPDSWSEKAQKLSHLVRTPAVTYVPTLLPYIAERINQHALETLKPAEIRNVSTEVGKYCPALLKQSRLDVLASFVEAFGSHRVENITDTVATTTRLLKNLEKILPSWRDYDVEFGSQLNTLSQRKQERFIQNCNDLLTFLRAEPALTTGPVAVFKELLDTLWQQLLRSTPTSKEPSETNPLKKWVNKLRDR